MDAWIKYFNDGSVEIGSDDLIKEKKASWTNGKLSNISKVSISGFSKNAILDIPNTEWFQFDKYLLHLEDSSPFRIARIIQAQIKEPFINQYLCYNKNKSDLFYLSNKRIKFSKKIEKDMLGKWISIVILDNKIDSFIVPNKGSLNAAKSIFK